jgi:hypothetical protein
MHKDKTLVIYGAGKSGLKLEEEYRNTPYKMRYFVDDDKRLQKRSIDSVRIISKEELKRIKDYVINPVDSREADLKKPGHLHLDLHEPDFIETADGFTQMDQAALLDYRQAMGFAMSGEDIFFVQEYFKNDEGVKSRSHLYCNRLWWRS